MADLRAEVGVLARTADILQTQYGEVKQLIVSCQKIWLRHDVSVYTKLLVCYTLR